MSIVRILSIKLSNRISSQTRAMIKLSAATRLYSTLDTCSNKSAPNGCLRRTTKPECPYRLVEPSRSTREILVEQMADLWVNEVEIIHGGQVVSCRNLYVTEYRRRRMIYRASSSNLGRTCGQL